MDPFAGQHPDNVHDNSLTRQNRRRLAAAQDRTGLTNRAAAKSQSIDSALESSSEYTGRIAHLDGEEL